MLAWYGSRIDDEAPCLAEAGAVGLLRSLARSFWHVRGPIALDCLAGLHGHFLEGGDCRRASRWVRIRQAGKTGKALPCAVHVQGDVTFLFWTVDCLSSNSGPSTSTCSID